MDRRASGRRRARPADPPPRRDPGPGPVLPRHAQPVLARLVADRLRTPRRGVHRRSDRRSEQRRVQTTDRADTDWAEWAWAELSAMARRLLTGATVWAGATCTPRPAWLLVEDDHVAALGASDGDQEPPPADQVLDVTGCHILPGFVDVHLHLSQAAWFPLGGDASAWRGLADALHAVRVAAAAEPQAPWLLFWSVARWRWPEARLPTARELDEAAPRRRVLVSTLDMHRGAVSSAALATLGLSDRGQGQAGDLGDDVTRDRRGRPTGELWEAAYGIALQRALTDAMAYAADAGAAAVLAAEANRCLALGISHAHDPYVSPDWHRGWSPCVPAARCGCRGGRAPRLGCTAGRLVPRRRPMAPTATRGGRSSCLPMAATAARSGCRRGRWLACLAARPGSRGGCGPSVRSARRCDASWWCARSSCTPRTCATPTPSWPA